MKFTSDAAAKDPPDAGVGTELNVRFYVRFSARIAEIEA